MGHPGAAGRPDAAPGATAQPATSSSAAAGRAAGDGKDSDGKDSDRRDSDTKASNTREPDRLGQLEARYPRWQIWRGRASGNLWAMPPRGHPTHHDLISARDAGELAKRLADAEQPAG